MPSNSVGPAGLFVSVKDTATLLGVPVKAVYDAIANEQLPAIGIGGRVVVPRRALEQLVEATSPDQPLTRSHSGEHAIPPLAEAIRSRRETSGLTQVQVGALLGVDQPTVSRWERGEQRVGIENLDRLAEWLGRSVADVAAANFGYSADVLLPVANSGALNDVAFYLREALRIIEPLIAPACDDEGGQNFV